MLIMADKESVVLYGAHTDYTTRTLEAIRETAEALKDHGVTITEITHDYIVVTCENDKAASTIIEAMAKALLAEPMPKVPLRFGVGGSNG